MEIRLVTLNTERLETIEYFCLPTVVVSVHLIWPGPLIMELTVYEAVVALLPRSLLDHIMKSVTLYETGRFSSAQHMNLEDTSVLSHPHATNVIASPV